MPTAMSAQQIAQTAYKAGWRGEDLIKATAVALAESGGRYWVVNSIGCVGLWQINVPVHVKGHPTWTTAAMKDPDRNAGAARVLWKDRGWKPWEVYTNGMYAAQMGRARLAVAQVDKTSGAGSGVNVGTGAGQGGGSVDQASWETVSGNADQVLLESLIPQLPSLIGPLYKWFDSGGGDALGGAVNPLGPLATMGKAFLAISVMTVRASAWMANPKNWLRVVEVIGGAVALFIGLKMLAGTGVGGPVAGAVRSGANTVSKTVKTVQKAGKTAAAATPQGRALAVAGAATGKA
ncbi:hypothetical protein [Streptomyces sp. NPDC048157]|uniref:hypothetical protein n=1 Tax=Streptomyces sp. NPDC048157 TaxID=3365503 RepID=UPI00371A5324